MMMKSNKVSVIDYKILNQGLQLLRNQKKILPVAFLLLPSVAQAQTGVNSPTLQANNLIDRVDSGLLHSQQGTITSEGDLLLNQLSSVSSDARSWKFLNSPGMMSDATGGGFMPVELFGEDPKLLDSEGITGGLPKLWDSATDINNSSELEGDSSPVSWTIDVGETEMNDREYGESAVYRSLIAGAKLNQFKLWSTQQESKNNIKCSDASLDREQSQDVKVENKTFFPELFVEVEPVDRQIDATVSSEIAGRNFSVNNFAGSPEVISRSMTSKSLMDREAMLSEELEARIADGKNPSSGASVAYKALIDTETPYIDEDPGVKPPMNLRTWVPTARLEVGQPIQVATQTIDPDTLGQEDLSTNSHSSSPPIAPYHAGDDSQIADYQMNSDRSSLHESVTMPAWQETQAESATEWNRLPPAWISDLPQTGRMDISTELETFPDWQEDSVVLDYKTETEAASAPSMTMVAWNTLPAEEVGDLLQTDSQEIETSAWQNYEIELAWSDLQSRNLQEQVNPQLEIFSNFETSWSDRQSNSAEEDLNPQVNIFEVDLLSRVRESSSIQEQLKPQLEIFSEVETSWSDLQSSSLGEELNPEPETNSEFPLNVDPLEDSELTTDTKPSTVARGLPTQVSSSSTDPTIYEFPELSEQIDTSLRSVAEESLSLPETTDAVSPPPISPAALPLDIEFPSQYQPENNVYSLNSTIINSPGSVPNNYRSSTEVYSSLIDRDLQDSLADIAKETNSMPGALYVIPFADYIEVMLLSPGQPIMRRIIRDTNASELNSTVKELIAEVTNPRTFGSHNYLNASQKLYQWLITPIEHELKIRGIDTLMFALDPRIPSLPIAVLHDGEQFLVEKYRLSLIPSLNLTDLSYQNLSNSSVLAMGAGFFADPKIQNLNQVPVELSAISQNRQSEVFINEEFTPENLQRQSRQGSYGIVHLATHVEFNPQNADSSYIQFWNSRLTLDQVQDIGWQNESLELLVMSACETAFGNQHSELGFAGVAIKNGVKSVLASLWQVDDRGTLGLMNEFYRHLSSQNRTIKAEALRQAQLAMLQGNLGMDNGELTWLGDRPQSNVQEVSSNLPESSLSHPYFWAAFTLVGNPW